MQLTGRRAFSSQEFAQARGDYLFDQKKSEEHRRYVICMACCLLSIAFFLFMAVLNFTDGYYYTSVVLLLCIFICVISLLLQLATSRSAWPASMLMATHISLTWYLVTSGGHDISSMIWSLVYPHAFMLWLGLRLGTLAALLFLASLVLLVFSPLDHVFPHIHTDDSLVRYLITLGGLCVLAFFSEYMRDLMQQKLIFLNRQMKSTALTDPLTGLGNRLAFEQHLRTEYARFLRQGDDFALILCDVDHFKSINDRKGHAAGDAVLQHTAELITRILRRQDAMFRWGGEEFVITLSGVPPHELAELAETLRASIAEKPCPYQGDRIYFTMSFGAYSCNPLESPAEAMDRADRLLYAAKRAGRNRVMTDDASF